MKLNRGKYHGGMYCAKEKKFFGVLCTFHYTLFYSFTRNYFLFLYPHACLPMWCNENYRWYHDDKVVLTKAVRTRAIFVSFESSSAQGRNDDDCDRWRQWWEKPAINWTLFTLFTLLARQFNEIARLLHGFIGWRHHVARGHSHASPHDTVMTVSFHFLRSRIMRRSIQNSQWSNGASRPSA